MTYQVTMWGVKYTLEGGEDKTQTLIKYGPTAIEYCQGILKYQRIVTGWKGTAHTTQTDSYQ